MNSMFSPHIGNPLSKIPVKYPTQDIYNRYIALFSLILGSYSRIIQTSINDLYDMVCERKELFRHSVKFNLNKAVSMADELIKEFMNMAKENKGDYLWVDTTSAVEHAVLNDINILFLSVDNILLKHKIKEDKIEAQTIVAYNLSAMMLDVFDNFCNITSDKGVNFKIPIIVNNFERRMSGICMAMHAVAEKLVSNPHADYLKEGDLIHRGLEVIALKVANVDFINKATENVLQRNGVAFDMDTDNSYLPWTAIQENLIKKYWGTKDFTIEELAQMVGRSVGAIKARAYKLGLIKKAI